MVALAYALSVGRIGAEDLAQEAFAVAERRWGVIGAYHGHGRCGGGASSPTGRLADLYDIEVPQAPTS